MPTPTVSVVLPAFDEGPVIERALGSILRQSLQEWELVVVDDGSTDETPAILGRWKKRDGRIRTLRIEHRGIVAALNAGIESSHAPFIARMDADDECFPERLAEQVDVLHKNPSVGLVGSLVEFGGDARGYALHVEWMNQLVTPQQIALNRFVESPFAHPSVMFRRDLVDHYGGYREGDFPEDYELWLRWMHAGVLMTKVPKVLLRWNDAPNRLSRKDPRYRPEAFYRCKASYLSRYVKEHAKSRALVIWGAGRPTRKRAEHLTQYGLRIAGYVDIDPAKQGKRFDGRPVFSPEKIPKDAFVVSYVGNRGAREIIRARLNELGFGEGRDFLTAA